MVRKIINKAISAVTTTLLAFTTLASAIPVTTYAAAAKDSIQKSTTKITSKNKDKAAGYGTFDFEADSSGYTFSHSSNLKKAVKTGPNKDWIWEDRDQGSADDKLKKLIGNAYIAKLNPDKSFWVEYSNVKKVDDEGNQLGNYDVKVVFDNAGGSISGAEGHDIAIFDGQLGAVRFRGYKHIRCTIYVYKHGTKTLISGADDKLHFRFLDIDCNQAVESMCPGRTDWYMMGSKVSWSGEPRCTKIGAEQGNTVTYNGDTNTPDSGILSPHGATASKSEKDAYRTACRYTWSVGFTPIASSPFTYRVRYFAGGVEDIGTQTNGAFFSFDGGLTLPPIPDEAELSIDKVSDKYVHKVGDSWDYTIKVKNVTDESQAVTAENVVITDTIPSGLKVNSVTTSKGTASHKGNAVTVNVGDLAQDATATVKVNVTALETSNGTRPYNTAKVVAENGSVDGGWHDDDGNYINSANVQVDKVVDKYEYAVGDKANFTVKVKNTKGIATNVTVADTLPSGMKLDYDSVKISGVPANVSMPVAPKDVTNQLNKTLFEKSETKTITATKSKSGDNGWAYKINYLPANATATITFSATAAEAGNGKEQQNVVTATGDNFSKAEDDAEYYVNTPKLSLSKKYVNPYKDKKKDNRCDNEFRVFEKETGYEKVQYEVLAKNTAPAGTVAKDVVVEDVTLPEGLALNYDSIEISEVSDSGTKTFSKASGGNGNTIKYHVAGTADVTNNPETQNSWNPSYVNTKKETLMSIKYDMKITDKALAGKDILNVATAVSDEALKVTTDETVKPKGPEPTPEKSVDRTNPAVGEDVTFTLRFTNNNAGTVAKDVKIKDFMNESNMVKIREDSLKVVLVAGIGYLGFVAVKRKKSK